MKFSVIVVCLNPGDKLEQTIDSILRQTCRDYEIIVKDGKSTDGSVDRMRSDERIPRDGRLRIYTEKDKGIYDAMNQAVAYAEGEFILFLNCGDVFYNERVLEKTAAYIDREKSTKNLVFYGDTYGDKRSVLISSPPKITGFVCYRNIPCHQVCFYASGLCKEKPYNQEFRIRADYEHFLWCYYSAGAKMVHMDVIVASYEGGGYSENAANKKRDREEHRRVMAMYMSRGEIFRYRLLMLGTLAPLRKALAESRVFSGVYHRLKERLYHYGHSEQ